MLPRILYEPIVFDKSKYDIEKELQYWDELVEQVKLYQIQNDPEFDFENIVFKLVPASQAIADLVSIETQNLNTKKLNRRPKPESPVYLTGFTINLESKPMIMCLTVT